MCTPSSSSRSTRVCDEGNIDLHEDWGQGHGDILAHPSVEGEVFPQIASAPTLGPPPSVLGLPSPPEWLPPHIPILPPHVPPHIPILTFHLTSLLASQSSHLGHGMCIHSFMHMMRGVVCCCCLQLSVSAHTHHADFAAWEELAVQWRAEDKG